MACFQNHFQASAALKVNLSHELRKIKKRAAVLTAHFDVFGIAWRLYLLHFAIDSYLRHCLKVGQ
jgi:hypothetical protein